MPPCAPSARSSVPALGIAIPVGKDSLSMKTAWQQDGEARSVVAPLSLIVSAFAPVGDVRRTLTPLLRLDAGPDIVAADRSGRRPQSPGRLGTRAGLWGAGRRAAPTWTTPTCCGDSSQALTALRDARPRARLPRSRRRRPCGHAGGNGIRQPLRFRSDARSGARNRARAVVQRGVRGRAAGVDRAIARSVAGTRRAQTCRNAARVIGRPLAELRLRFTVGARIAR